jgi:uncharacterized membrane protein YgdD (TMEM256/DUF423 family)
MMPVKPKGLFRWLNGRVVLTLGAVFGGCGVVLGAIGAHALTHLSPALQDAYQTATGYHLIHAVGLLAVGVWLRTAPHPLWLRWAALAWVVGIVLFSGSIYLHALLGERWLPGWVTPLGGLALIAGWVMLAAAAWRGAAP